MNLHQNPELLDRLAAAYALGTLRGGARRRFETLAREHPAVRAAALIWQMRVGALGELQTPQAPPPQVWTRISNALRTEREQQALARARVAAAAPAPSGGWLRSLLLWRAGTAAGAFATVIAIVTAVGLREQLGVEITALQARLDSAPQISYVAVLNDEQSNASVLVTFDPKNNRLTLQRVGGFQEAANQSLQLWALPPGGAPRSLGVLGKDRLLQLPAGESAVREVPTLAISLEPQGGVPSERGPTGPVLFKGALIQKAL